MRTTLGSGRKQPKFPERQNGGQKKFPLSNPIFSTRSVSRKERETTDFVIFFSKITLQTGQVRNIELVTRPNNRMKLISSDSKCQFLAETNFPFLLRDFYLRPVSIKINWQRGTKTQIILYNRGQYLAWSYLQMKDKKIKIDYFIHSYNKERVPTVRALCTKHSIVYVENSNPGH